MYICEDCGKIYEDEEAVSVEEMPYGEEHCGLGKPMWDMNRAEVEACSCGGELVKAKKCEKCDEWMSDNSHSLCEDCANEYATLETVLAIGADWETKMSLNGFLCSVYSKEEIELILMDALTAKGEDFIKSEIKKYCDEDKDYFMGEADKRWKEGK
jgi:hypothetical protein